MRFLEFIRNIYVIVKNKYEWWELTSPTYRYILVLKGAYLKKLVRKAFKPKFYKELRKEDIVRLTSVNLTNQISSSMSYNGYDSDNEQKTGYLLETRGEKYEAYRVQTSQNGSTGITSILR